MKTLALASMTLLGAGLIEASTPPLDPAAILARAVVQFETCSFGKLVGRGRDDSHGDTGLLEIPEKDMELVKKLSLPILFRTGRFILEDKEFVLIHRREARLINFSPRLEREQLERRAEEDRDVAKVMNRLSGSIYIDRQTEHFIRIEAKLAEAYNFWTLKKFIPLPVTMSELWLSIEPESEEAWKPGKLVVEFDGHGPRSLGKPKRRHEQHTTTLSCLD